MPLPLLRRNEVFLVNMVHPDCTMYTKFYSSRRTVQSVLADACKRLMITSHQLYGVAQHKNNEFNFLSGKKQLIKILPKATLLSVGEGEEEEAMKLSSGSKIKSCRLYLRVKHFRVDFSRVEYKSLQFCCNQARTDALKNENTFNDGKCEEAFIDCAAYSIALAYGHSAITRVSQGNLNFYYYLPQTLIVERVKTIVCDKLHDILADTHNKEPLGLELENKLLLNTMRALQQLEYFGTYFYYISVSSVDGDYETCKLGVGPRGLLLCTTNDYTTWYQMLQWDWREIKSVSMHKNVVSVHVLFSKWPSDCDLVCLDRTEAKALYKTIVDIQNNKLESKGRFLRMKRNSVGALPNPEVPIKSDLYNYDRKASLF